MSELNNVSKYIFILCQRINMYVLITYKSREDFHLQRTVLWKIAIVKEIFGSFSFSCYLLEELASCNVARRSCMKSAFPYFCIM